MVILKCKMCGGDIQIGTDQNYETCTHCGGTMALPRAPDERRANMFNRANHFRRRNEFDKALTAYESILNEDNTDAEAYWGITLCRYGIEYVEDPISLSRIPICHRVQHESILLAPDYLAALEHAPDEYTRNLYEQEAQIISEIQEDILAISQKEEPFDVFICCKESAGDGSHTEDSMLAQDVYYQLTQAGYKVFFSKITLENKPGDTYEPYIFNALNSAQVMLVIGTCAEHFNAVWVKNEWSRYLALAKKDGGRLIIPCCQGMDPYDMPEELSILQSQDMGKIGFMQDLICGVEKVLGIRENQSESASAQVPVMPDVESLVACAYLFMESEKFDKAIECIERVLEIDPQCAQAYIAKYLAENRLKTKNSIVSWAVRHFKGRVKQLLKSLPDSLRKPIQPNSVLQQSIDNLQSRGALGKDVIERYLFDNAYLPNKLAAIDEIKQNFAYTETDKNYEKALRFASPSEKEEYSGYVQKIYDGIEKFRQEMENEEDEATWEAQNRYDKRLVEKFAFLTKLAKLSDKTGKTVSWSDVSSRFLNHILSVGGYDNIVSLLANGRVVSTKLGSEGQSAVSSWINIIAVAASPRHTVGLRADGMVVANGYNNYDQCNVSGWKNIIAVAAGAHHTVGLCLDGTVVFTGKKNSCYGESNVSDWSDIIAIAAGAHHTVGLRSDGTVVVTKGEGGPTRPGWFGWDIVPNWENIIAVAAGGSEGGIVGLRSDGTVVAKCLGDVSGWRDVIAIAAGYEHAAGLRADGTVVSTRRTTFRALDENYESNWKNIIAIAAGGGDTVGLRADGTIVGPRISRWYIDWQKIVNSRIEKHLQPSLWQIGQQQIVGIADSQIEKQLPETAASGWQTGLKKIVDAANSQVEEPLPPMSVSSQSKEQKEQQVDAKGDPALPLEKHLPETPASGWQAGLKKVDAKSDRWRPALPQSKEKKEQQVGAKSDRLRPALPLEKHLPETAASGWQAGLKKVDAKGDRWRPALPQSREQKKQQVDAKGDH